MLTKQSCAALETSRNPFFSKRGQVEVSTFFNVQLHVQIGNYFEFLNNFKKLDFPKKKTSSFLLTCPNKANWKMGCQVKASNLCQYLKRLHIINTTLTIYRSNKHLLLVDVTNQSK